MKTFMYHDIRDYKNTKYPSRLKLKSFLTVDEFREQLKYISKNYQIINPHDITEYIQDSAILTFDDGLTDHYYIAEMLFDMKITGTFLVPAQSIKDRVVIKSHKIQFILASIDEKELVQRILNSPHGNISNQHLWNKYSVSKWKDNWWTPEMIFTTNILRHYDTDGSLTDKLFIDIVTGDEEDFCSDFYLHESQIHDIVSMGHNIGGHGHTSEDLTTINNQESDIKKSLNYIQQFYDYKVLFSYPNGGYNKQTLELMKKYNVDYAFTTIKGDINESGSMLEIPRYDASQDIKIKI